MQARLTRTIVIKSDVSLAYYYEDYYLKFPPITDDIFEETPSSSSKREAVPVAMPLHIQNRTLPEIPANTTLSKRVPISLKSTDEWALSQNSLPAGMVWKSPESGSFQDGGGPGKDMFLYNYNDDPDGEGQTVYMLDETTIWLWHKVCQHLF